MSYPSHQIVNVLVFPNENNTTSLTPLSLPGIDFVRSLSYLAIAAVLVVFYRIYTKLSVPPKLRHLPSVPFSKIGAALLRREPLDVMAHKLFLPHHKEHGLVVQMREGEWCVSVANPEYAKKILLRLDVFPKRLFPFECKETLVVRLFGTSSIAQRNGDQWKRHHKVTNRAFQRSLPVKVFGGLSQKVFQKIESEGCKHIEVHSWMQRLTLDSIGLAGFGFNFDSIEDPENSWANSYNDVMAGVSIPVFCMFPELEKYFLWAFPKRREVHRKMDKLDALFKKMITDKKYEIAQKGYDSSEDFEKDLLTTMIESNSTEHSDGLSDQELRDNIALFFVAGHDTSANALSTAIYFLAANKDVQEKARKEALTVLGDAPHDIIPTIDQTKELKYINQVMKEAMRMFPPASIVTLRQTTEDVDLGLFYIPKGTNVALDIYSMHHNPNNWEDPEEFNPDRFIEDNEKLSGSYSWIAFGNGARQCIGMNFALIQERVFLCMLLRKFEFSLPADSIHLDGLKLDPNPSKAMTPLNVVVDFQPRY